MEQKFSIVNRTKSKLPHLPFLRIKNDILGRDYFLSLAFVDEHESKTINKKYRNKNNSTNILSFLLHKNEGEIIICPKVVKQEAKNFDKTFPEFLGFLVIHGMLHLKGLEHGRLMKKEEEKYLSHNGFT